MDSAQAPGLDDRLLRLWWRLRPFYRRYPYPGGGHIGHADWRGAIDTDHRFFYNRIAKCANSTITQTLAIHAGKPYSERAQTAKDAFTHPSALSAEQTQALASDYFKFTFVRDPYVRLLSAYLDKIVRKRYDTRRGYRALRAGRGDEPPSIDRFIAYLADGGLYANPHWAPQTSLFLIPQAEFDFIGRVETLEADLEFVLGRLFPDRARQGRMEISRSGPRATGAKDRVDELLAPANIARVSRLYEADIAGLGYAFL